MIYKFFEEFNVDKSGLSTHVVNYCPQSLSITLMTVMSFKTTC